MNKKIALVGDTHFGYRKAIDIFSNYQQKFIDEVLFPYLLENDIKIVVQFGDLFESRKVINGKTLKFVHEQWFKRFEENDITLYQMNGNHDVFFKNTNRINWIDSMLDNSTYTKIINCSDVETHKIYDTDIDILPWINEENEHKVFDHMKNSKAKYLFGHLEMSGFELTPGHFSQHGHSMKPFKKYDRVLSGHYHIRSKKGNIQYTGIPYQLNWNDSQDKKGFWILDTEKDNIEFIENKNRLFHKIDYDENDIDLKTFDFDSLRKSYVKVIIRNKKDESKFNDFLTRLNSLSLHDLSIISTNEIYDHDIDLEDIEIEDTLSILTKFVLKNVNDNLDEDRVVKHIKNLYSEGLLLMKDI